MAIVRLIESYGIPFEQDFLLEKTSWLLSNLGSESGAPSAQILIKRCGTLNWTFHASISKEKTLTNFLFHRNPYFTRSFFSFAWSFSSRDFQINSTEDDWDLSNIDGAARNMNVYRRKINVFLSFFNLWKKISSSFFSFSGLSDVKEKMMSSLTQWWRRIWLRIEIFENLKDFLSYFSMGFDELSLIACLFDKLIYRLFLGFLSLY